jgi:Protein of unknown function (DUF433)
MTFIRITVNPRQMEGVPCIGGLLIPVPKVVGIVADGMSEEEFFAAYTDLKLSTFVRPCVMLLRWWRSVSSRWYIVDEVPRRQRPPALPPHLLMFLVLPLYDHRETR